MSNPNERTLMRQCVDGVCHCDFRLTVTNCVEGWALRLMYLSFIGLSALVIVIGIGIAADRYFRKGHQLFETGTGRGFLRPKPIDCLVFFITVFNTIRMLSAILIVIDHDPTNVLTRSFMFEFSWHFGYAACALYLLGIAQTLSESHKNLTRGWLPSPKTVDVIGITFMMGPVVLHNICSISAGALAYSHLAVAEVFTNLLYGFWFMHCFTLSLTVLFAGARLIRILTCHLSRFPPTGERYKSIRIGIFKIQALMSIIVLCLAGYSVFLLVYACVRDQVTQSSAGSIAMATIWNFWAPVATLLGEIALIIDPKLGEQTNFGIKSSSHGKSTNTNTNTTTTTSNAMNTTFSQQGQSTICQTMASKTSQYYQQGTTTFDGSIIAIPSPTATTAPTLSLGVFDPYDRNKAEHLNKPMFATEVDHTGLVVPQHDVDSGIPMQDTAYFFPSHHASPPDADDAFTIYSKQQDGDSKSRSSKSHLIHYGL